MAANGSGAARRAGRPTRRVSRRWAALFTLVIIVTAGIVFRQVVQAVHDTGVFELDGNVTAEVTHDWENVYDDFVNGTMTAGTSTISFDTDGSSSASIFTGGGSKDPIDMNQWAWKNA